MGKKENQEQDFSEIPFPAISVTYADHNQVRVPAKPEGKGWTCSLRQLR